MTEEIWPADIHLQKILADAGKDWKTANRGPIFKKNKQGDLED